MFWFKNMITRQEKSDSSTKALHYRQYRKYDTLRRDLGCARRKFEVCSVQRLASVGTSSVHILKLLKLGPSEVAGAGELY